MLSRAERRFSARFDVKDLPTKKASFATNYRLTNFRLHAAKSWFQHRDLASVQIRLKTVRLRTVQFSP